MTQDFPKGCEKPQSTLGYCEEMSSAPVLAVDSSWELFSRGTCPRRSPYQSPCSSRFQGQWGVSLSIPRGLCPVSLMVSISASLEVSISASSSFPGASTPMSLASPSQYHWCLHPNVSGVSIPVSLESPSQYVLWLPSQGPWNLHPNIPGVLIPAFLEVSIHCISTWSAGKDWMGH